MGMFSSLFGSSGSDKADKMRQQALDAFNSVKTPELSALQVQLNDYVNAGKITPEQAEAEMLNSNAFNSIKTDPSFAGAAKQALQGLQGVASQGGMTPIDRARLQDITDEQNQENHSANDAIMADARARGIGNSSLSAVNQLVGEQGSADRAARSGLQVNADAQARALQALQAGGQLGQSLQAQDFGQQAQKAQSQNAIDQFNAANSTDMNKFNTSNNLATQQANLNNAQNVANLNTETQNQNKLYNSGQNQTVFNDEMSKATGKAGTLNQWAGDAQKQAEGDSNRDLALTGGIISAGSTAMGGSFGATTPKPQKDSGYADGGMVLSPNQHWEESIDPEHYSKMLVETPNTPPEPRLDLSAATDPTQQHAKSIGPEQLAGKPTIEDEYDKFVKQFAYGGKVCMADGGSVEIRPAKNMKAGGKVPGTPKVPGDSPVNDTVPAKLSPGEVVLPRTVVNNPEKISHFVKATTGFDPVAAALRRMTAPKL